MKLHRRWLALCIAVLLCLGVSGAGMAAPSAPVAAPAASAQIPDWLSGSSASRLSIGIDVYAPSWLPTPFGGEPEILAYEGYYSFYWLIPGTPVTYLRVTGEAGGTIPAYSAADRNNQLLQNANVMGYPAYHDLTPVYDLVYWKIGNVVYSVDSFNVGSDSMTIASNLMLVTPTQPDIVGGQENASSSVSIGAPASVQSGQTAAIGVAGEGQVLLSAQDGYFPATGENTVIVEAGGSVDWVAPQYESDATLYFYAYNPETGAELASASTYLEGFLSEGEAVSAQVECPASVSVGNQAQVMVTGSGSIGVVASGGAFPAETSNTAFDGAADGDQSLIGTLGANSAVVLAWVAPDEAGTYYVTVYDMNDAFLDECSVEVVIAEVDGSLNTETDSSGEGIIGDGTGVTDVDPGIVLRAIANPSGFAGDASGGPEANAPDYGYTLGGSASSGDGTGDASDESTNDEAEQEAESEASLGPATGANGMVAQSMGRSGGILENPAGARVIVPRDALTDQTTVMLQPVSDHDLPTIAGITLVSGTAFDVAFSAADGMAAEPLSAPAQLTIALDSAGSDAGARIYRIDGSVAEPMPVIDSDQGSVTTEVNEISRYVVGVPNAAVVGSTRSFNPFIVGGLALIALVSAGLLISQGFSRRKTRIIPVRRPAPNRVRYR